MMLISLVGQMVGKVRDQGGTNQAQVLGSFWEKGPIQPAHSSRSTLKEMKIGLIFWLTNRPSGENNCWIGKLLFLNIS